MEELRALDEGHTLPGPRPAVQQQCGTRRAAARALMRPRGTDAIKPWRPGLGPEARGWIDEHCRTSFTLVDFLTREFRYLCEQEERQAHYDEEADRLRKVRAAGAGRRAGR